MFALRNFKKHHTNIFNFQFWNDWKFLRFGESIKTLQSSKILLKNLLQKLVEFLLIQFACEF